MNTELRKRLEEAADKFCIDNGLPSGACASQSAYGNSCMSIGFKAGAELGYKEAITMAKKWLNNHLGKDNGTPYFIKAFEEDMNKLWEDEK